MDIADLTINGNEVCFDCNTVLENRENGFETFSFNSIGFDIIYLD